MKHLASSRESNSTSPTPISEGTSLHATPDGQLQKTAVEHLVTLVMNHDHVAQSFSELNNSKEFSTMKTIRDYLLVVAGVGSLSLTLASTTLGQPVADKKMMPLKVQEANTNVEKSSVDLQLLGLFETLDTLGFTPDDVTYSPEKNHLFISSTTGGSTPGVFEVTLDGQLVRQLSFPGGLNLTGSLGFSIARVLTGPKNGHVFLAEFNSTPTVRVQEFDSELHFVADFVLVGSVWPGDSMAYNRFRQSLVIGDDGSGELSEVTTDGQFLRRFSVPATTGVTFNPITGTFFGVNWGNLFLYEFTMTGTLVRTFDLASFGLKHPVGVAFGGGKLFVADEGDPSNTEGLIYIFRSPTR